MSDLQTPAPSLDALTNRCKAQGWGYEVACEPTLMRGMNHSVSAVKWECRAEVQDASGMVVAIDGAATGAEALEEAVAGMDRWNARLASGRE